MQSTLINFNVPDGIRHRFDEVCRASGRTRTSVLIELMESYVLTQGRALADRHVEIRKVDQTLSEIRELMGSREFLAHQPSRDEIAVQSPAKSEFEPLPFGWNLEDEEEWAKAQAWLASFDDDD